MAATILKYPFIDGCKDIPSDKNNNVRDIRKWLETQPQLPKLSEEFVHLFLHSNYYNFEETKSNIQAYFSLRLTSPEIYLDRSLSDPKIRTALKNQFLAMVPKKTPEGYQVVFIGLKNQQNYVQVDSMKAMFMFFDIMTSECGLCPGYIVVYDTKTFTLPIFFKQRYSLIMKLSKYLQEAAPVRIKHLLVINSVAFVDRVFSIMRPFLRSSLMEKTQVYPAGNDLTNFYEIVPRECVFDEYGGTAGSIEAAHDKFLNLIETKYSNWIEDESIYAVEQLKKESKPARNSFFSFW